MLRVESIISKRVTNVIKKKSIPNFIVTDDLSFPVMSL
jgi:hypothetical protein